jgi:hypothetical protein
MTSLLNLGIETVRNLSDEQQDAAGELLLRVADLSAGEHYKLTPAQIADIHQSICEVDRGELASEAEMAELWRYCNS